MGQGERRYQRRDRGCDFAGRRQASRSRTSEVWHDVACGEERGVASGSRDRLTQLRHGAYLAAWLYVAAWIAASSGGWVPASLRVAAIGVTAAALLFIMSVLLAPRPAGSPRAASDLPYAGSDDPRAARL